MTAHLYRPITDAQGNLRVNSQVALYAPGTTTLLSTPFFSDDALTQAVANPFDCPSGVIDIYCASAQRMDVGVTPPGSTEVVVHDIDTSGGEDATFDTVAGYASAQIGGVNSLPQVVYKTVPVLANNALQFDLTWFGHLNTGDALELDLFNSQGGLSSNAVAPTASVDAIGQSYIVNAAGTAWIARTSSVVTMAPFDGETVDFAQDNGFLGSVITWDSTTKTFSVTATGMYFVQFGFSVVKTP